jgi:hypothetical protein
MLARRAGLLDWDRRSLRWAMLAIAIALLIGALAQRTVPQELQASDPIGAATIAA